MARIVNEAAYTARRNAILDAAQRAIVIKGYEQMAIADLLSELRISSGAFYHYFDSKPALMIALVERILDQLEERVLPIIHDPELSGLEKLQRFFRVLDREKLDRKRFVLAYLRSWYSDENAIVRYKLYVGRLKRFTPWLEEMIQQGVEEGSMTAPYPDQAARMMLALLEDLGYATVNQLLASEHTPDDVAAFKRIIEAMFDALERVLGTAPNSFLRTTDEELAQWLMPDTAGQETS